MGLALKLGVGEGFVIAYLNTWAKMKKFFFSQMENPLLWELCLTGQYMVGYLCTNFGGSSIEIGCGERIFLS